MLACVHRKSNVAVTRVIFTIREKHDKVSAGCMIDRPKLRMACTKDSVENGGSPQRILPACDRVAHPRRNCRLVAGPGLRDR